MNSECYDQGNIQCENSLVFIVYSDSYNSLLSKYLSTIQHIMLQCQTLVHAISFIVAHKKSGIQLERCNNVVI